MEPDPAVEDLDVLRDGGRARALMAKDWRKFISFFSEAKKLAAAERCQHTPVLPVQDP